MQSSTFRRWLVVLSFAFVGSSMAFLVGARAGAALNGHVNGLTLGHMPVPRIQAAVEVPSVGEAFTKQ